LLWIHSFNSARRAAHYLSGQLINETLIANNKTDCRHAGCVYTKWDGKTYNWLRHSPSGVPGVESRARAERHWKNCEQSKWRGFNWEHAGFKHWAVVATTAAAAPSDYFSPPKLFDGGLRKISAWKF
jgi:hypothetical protein